ncbi:MAG: NrsF family protein, partial [Pseudomonadota bacterium]
MDKQASREDLIAALAQDMTPVERVKPAHGAALIAFAAVVASACCIFIFEFWAGQLTGDAPPFFWITNGLLLLLGASSVSGLVASALPRVGSRGNAPFWSAGMLALAPITAFITVVSWA